MSGLCVMCTDYGFGDGFGLINADVSLESSFSSVIVLSMVTPSCNPHRFTPNIIFDCLHHPHPHPLQPSQMSIINLTAFKTSIGTYQR